MAYTQQRVRIRHHLAVLAGVGDVIRSETRGIVPSAWAIYHRKRAEPVLAADLPSRCLRPAPDLTPLKNGPLLKVKRHPAKPALQAVLTETTSKSRIFQRIGVLQPSFAGLILPKRA